MLDRMTESSDKKRMSPWHGTLLCGRAVENDFFTGWPRNASSNTGLEVARDLAIIISDYNEAFTLNQKLQQFELIN